MDWREFEIYYRTQKGWTPQDGWQPCSGNVFRIFLRQVSQGARRAGQLLYCFALLPTNVWSNDALIASTNWFIAQVVPLFPRADAFHVRTRVTRVTRM